MKVKEIHDEFTIVRVGPKEQVFGTVEFKVMGIRRGGHFMDFRSTGTVISMN